MKQWKVLTRPAAESSPCKACFFFSLLLLLLCDRAFREDLPFIQRAYNVWLVGWMGVKTSGLEPEQPSSAHQPNDSAASDIPAHTRARKPVSAAQCFPLACLPCEYCSPPLQLIATADDYLVFADSDLGGNELEAIDDSVLGGLSLLRGL